MTIASLREKLQQVAPIVRRIIGAPDYDGYIAHVRKCHPDLPVPSRDEFVESRLRDRYSRPGTRCC